MKYLFILTALFFFASCSKQILNNDCSIQPNTGSVSFTYKFKGVTKQYATTKDALTVGLQNNTYRFNHSLEPLDIFGDSIKLTIYFVYVGNTKTYMVNVNINDNGQDYKATTPHIQQSGGNYITWCKGEILDASIKSVQVGEVEITNLKFSNIKDRLAD